jgi:hypothetical protein
MTHLFIGAGQAGGALAYSVFKYKNIRLIAQPLAINSTARDLANVRKIIRRDKWLGISDQWGIVSGKERKSVFEERVAIGFGKDPVKASEVIEKHYESLLRALEKPVKVLMAKRKGGDKAGHTPFSLIFTGFGGGTGCGIAPYIAKALKELSKGEMTVFVIGVLPAVGDKLEAWNARYGINKLRDFADSFILVDNQRIANRPDFVPLYGHYNDYIAAGITDLIMGTLLERIDPSKYPFNPPVIEIKDIKTATSFEGEPGFTAFARVSDISRSLFQYFIPAGAHKGIDTLTMCRKAVAKTTIADIDVMETEKNLAVLRVPPYYLQKEERLDIKSVKNFMLEHSKMDESHFGVSLTKRNLVSLTALFTYKYDELERLKEIEKLAGEYRGRSKSQ